MGLDPGRMLRDFGLTQGCLQDPELKVPIDAVRGLLEASAERSGVEAFGLLMAETRRLSSLGPLGLLIREQPTLRLAVEALALYANRLNAALFLTIEDAGDVVVLREELISGGSGSLRQSTELAIGVALRCCKRCWGPTGNRGACASLTTRRRTVLCTSGCSDESSNSATTSTASSVPARISRARLRMQIR